MSEVIRVSSEKDVLRLLREVAKGNTFTYSPLAIGRLEDVEKRLDVIIAEAKEKVVTMLNQIAKDVTATELKAIEKDIEERGNMNDDVKMLLALYKVSYDRIVYMKITIALAMKLLLDTLHDDEIATLMTALKLSGIDDSKVAEIMKTLNQDDNRDVF